MRDFHAPFADVGVDALRTAAVLRTEQQPVAALEFRVPEACLRLCGEQPYPARRRGERRAFESLPVGVVHDVEALPVVHAAAFELRVGDCESERVDEVQTRPEHRAHSADIARVLRDFRAVENYMQNGIIVHACVRSSLPAPEIQGARRLSRGFALLDVLALVVELFARAERDEDFRERLFEIYFERDYRDPSGIRRRFEFEDFPLCLLYTSDAADD